MSVINKMLNDLGDRQDNEKAKKEVAFLTPTKIPSKKRMLIWSGILVVLLVVVSSLYLEDIARMLGYKLPKKTMVLTPEQIQQRMEAVARAKTPQLESAKNENADQTVTEQPELIVLPKPGDIAQTQKRASTLAVVAVETASPERTNPPVNSSTKSSTATEIVTAKEAKSQVNENLKPEVSDEPEQDPPQQSQANVTSSLQPKLTGAPRADHTKMQVSRVNLTPQQRVEKIFAEAQKLSQSGLISEALEKYNQLLQIQADHQDARIELAALYYGRTMVADALSVLDDGLEIIPSNVGWSLLAAKIHYKRTNYAAAFSYLQIPVETYDQIEYVSLKATTAYKLKEYALAEQAYQALTVADPGNGRWWLGLGTSLESSGQEVAAVAAYRKSLKLSNISQGSRQFVQSRLRQLEN